MVSEIIRFRETKEFRAVMREAEDILPGSTKSDIIRILLNLGLERLKESFRSIENVTHTLKPSETDALASSIKIFLLKAKDRQLKELKRNL